MSSKMTTKRIFDTLVGTVDSDEDYEVLSKKGANVRFRFIHHDVIATISAKRSSVAVQTESIFNVSVGHPASYAIETELRGRDFYAKVLPSRGLVLSLEFSVDREGDVIANGRTLGPYVGTPIRDMKGAIDAIWLIVMERFPYLAGQQAVRVGDEVIIVAENREKVIHTVISTVITKPANHKFTSVFREWFLGSTSSYDDDRLLPNFFFKGETLQFFAPRHKFIEKKGNVSRFETTGTEKRDSKPFFEFISNLSKRIKKLPVDRKSLCHTIVMNIETLLSEKILIGTQKGETIITALNSDVRDHYYYAVEHGVTTAVSQEDVEEMAKWRKLIGDAVLFGKYEERVMKSRFAARAIGETSKVLGADKRKVNRVGSGFSVYISPIEAQLCNLGREASIELIEEGNAKYLAVKRLLS